MAAVLTLQLDEEMFCRFTRNTRSLKEGKYILIILFRSKDIFGLQLRGCGSINNHINVIKD